VPVYLVRIRCDSIRATLEGEPRKYAFLKNEFVRAANSDLAIEKSLSIVRGALSSKPGIERSDAASAKLVVDETRENESFFRLFERHGFVFSPAAQDANRLS
jgi:hypothetical protein